MRTKHYLSILLTSVLPASAVVVVADDFSYADGALAGQGAAGAGWSGSWAVSGVQGGDGNQVSSTTVLTADNTASSDAGQFDTRPVSSTFLGTSNSLYFGATMLNNIPSGNYAQWVVFTGAANPSDPNAAPRVQFGLADGAYSLRGNTGGPGGDAGSYTSGSVVNLVGRADYNAAGAITALTLWDSPTSEADTPISSLTGLNITGLSSITGVTVGNFVFPGASTGTIDDVVLATEFTDIVPDVVPEPSSALLSAVGLLSLLTLRRRK